MLKDCQTVLELGCGVSSLLVKSRVIENKEVTGVDIYRPYVETNNASGLYKECILSDILDVQFKDGQFDAVVCMDVIEHIERERVLESGLLENMKRWGRKVVITTPNGFTENDAVDDSSYQIHRSGWIREDFEQYGYKVRGLSGWKGLRIKGAELRYQRPYLFWAGISLLTCLATYFVPDISYHLLVTYEQKNYNN